MTQAGAEATLAQAVKDGAQGFGEMKFHVAADGPELRRIYALAAELQVPILIHFQEVDHFENEGAWGSGYAQTFERVLKAFPKTTFIGHADAFWANVSADYHNEAAYPSGPIRRGGITDRLLGDYANLHGDLSANSGNNALSRDPGFTADFLARHQDKLMFGSDCGCSDGHGGGRQPGEQSRRGTAGGQVRRARDAHGAEEVRRAGDLPEDRVGQRAPAAEDPGMNIGRLLPGAVTSPIRQGPA